MGWVVGGGGGGSWPLKNHMYSLEQKRAFTENGKRNLDVLNHSVKISFLVLYSKTCVKRPPSKRPKIGFQDQLSLNAGKSIAE